MKIGIMQPYFFPYLGYFALIHATDRWIVFDTPQYIRKGWVNRNRIMKKGGGWKYFGIPVRRSHRDIPICEVVVSEADDWRGSILRNLDYYREQRAPYYRETLSFLEWAFDVSDTNLSALLIRFLRMTCEHIGLRIDYEVFSAMDLDLGPIRHAGEWALRISETLRADTYINPPGGRGLFMPDAFNHSGVELRFLSHRLPRYYQGYDGFEPGLSIVDVLMWNSRSETLSMVEDYVVEP